MSDEINKLNLAGKIIHNTQDPNNSNTTTNVEPKNLESIPEKEVPSVKIPDVVQNDPLEHGFGF